MKDFRYPDTGSPYDDATILKNVVYFSTAARAHSAQLILEQPLGIGQQELLFSAVEAFSEFMTSTEDMLGWFFTLQEWQPGNTEFSLLLLFTISKVLRDSFLKTTDELLLIVYKVIHNESTPKICIKLDSLFNFM